jgi:lipid II:glycine glycyltransferase (peptidoglycan interpeptide bridge formation enzyme)
MNIWQSTEWAELQKAQGNAVFTIEGVQVIQKPLRFGFSLFEVARANPSKIFWSKLESRAAKENTVFCRFAAELPTSSTLPLHQQSSSSRYPSATRVIDLSPSLDEIFGQFTSTGRRHCRKAEKSGVEIVPSTNTELFTELSQITAKRDGFAAHSASYFDSFLETFAENSILLEARFQNEVLAMGIFVISGATAYYYYGASSNEYRELNAPTLLQFKAMEWAKKKAAASFDLLGIAPENKPHHPLVGVTRFKQKFGGNIVSYYPESDIIYKPLAFKALSLLKYIRQALIRQ